MSFFEILLYYLEIAHAQSYKLAAQTQVIGWALWCLWTAISLVSAYAFFLGIVTPLTSYKRIPTRVNSIRVDNSAIIPSRFISHPVQSSSFVSHSQVSTRGIAKIYFSANRLDRFYFYCLLYKLKTRFMTFFSIPFVYFNKHSNVRMPNKMLQI